MNRCLTCDPRSCRPGYVYVVWDGARRLSKIGCSVNFTSRMNSYRANGNYHIEWQHKQVAGCEWSAKRREAKALRLLASRAERVQGDWFRCEPEAAIACVEQACKGYSGARWK